MTTNDPSSDPLNDPSHTSVNEAETADLSPHDPSTSAPASARETAADVTPVVGDNGAPESIGQYRIERVIGEGGMGAVYLARQSNPDRPVALKVVRAGYASRQLLRRFELEAQLLGRLRHAGIAHIYEAGTFDTPRGPQPFFAMEFVEGRPLDAYAKDRELSRRARLELIATIADAVHHAHVNGIVHRDLKPGNILVTGDGEAKVLDFGVARATDSDINTATIQIDVGQLIGTVPYMSPEQVAGNSDDIDARSDVYALGVVLYELLAGRRPHELNNTMLHEAVRITREDDPRPLSTFDRVLRGDVDTIVAKAMEKDKLRRYQSAADLAADIRRHLADEPIVARPPSTTYQLVKFTRRNRALVGGLAAVFVVLTAGVIVSTTLAVRAIDAEQTARASLAEAYVQSSEYGQALPVLRETVRLNASVHGQSHSETIGAQNTLAQALTDMTEFEEAEAIYGETLAHAMRGYGPDHPITLKTRGNIAWHQYLSKDFEAAAATGEPLLEDMIRVFGEEHQATGNIRNTLALAYKQLLRWDESEALQRKELQIARNTLGERHPSTLISMTNLGSFLWNRGQPAEAIEVLEPSVALHRDVLGDGNPGTAYTLLFYAGSLQDVGRLEEAEAPFLESHAIFVETLGPDHFMVHRIAGHLVEHYELRALPDQAAEWRGMLPEKDEPPS